MGDPTQAAPAPAERRGADGMELVDALADLAQDVPPGYCLVLEQAPPQTPFALRSSSSPASGAEACRSGPRHNIIAGEKPRLGATAGKRRRAPCQPDTPVAKMRLWVEMFVRDAAQGLRPCEGMVRGVRPCTLYSIEKVGEPTEGHVQIDWPQLIRAESARRNELDRMQRAWHERMSGLVASTEDALDCGLAHHLVAEQQGASTLMKPQDLILRLIVNPADSAHWVDCGPPEDKSHPAGRLYLPPRSAFLATDLLAMAGADTSYPKHCGWTQLLLHAEQHPPSLVLLDPPYPNYSAKRTKRSREAYKPVADLYDLWRIVDPVRRLLSCARQTLAPIVGCWVTNDPKAQRFVLEKLFPAWGLTHVGQLIWLKTTATHGQLVFPLDNAQGRKPYEVLLIGRPRREGYDHGDSESESRSKDAKLRLEGASSAPAPLQTRAFACAPLGHSRKPPVLPRLRPWLAGEGAGKGKETGPNNTWQDGLNVNVYELFARTTSRGPGTNGHWVSTGNEPCLFNQLGVGFAPCNGNGNKQEDKSPPAGGQ